MLDLVVYTNLGKPWVLGGTITHGPGVSIRRPKAIKLTGLKGRRKRKPREKPLIINTETRKSWSI